MSVMTLTVMVAIETCVRKVFSKEGVSKKQDNLKAQLMADIKKDEDILFHWSILAVNWDEQMHFLR